jgi:superfamily I DNA and/or RNA helicase
MHPDIAEFSHQHIYYGEALISPDGMASKRAWEYPQYKFRAEWVDVKGQPGHKTSNQAEASEIIKRLEDFDRWARGHSNDGKPWEVVVLCFYRGQEFELQQRLKKWTGSNSKCHFQRGDKSRPYLSIQLCTVDRFQGHEADLVFLSFSNNHVTSFLESPNRLNVALTRARYQLVIVGNRQAFKNSESLAGTLANVSKWSVSLDSK